MDLRCLKEGVSFSSIRRGFYMKRAIELLMLMEWRLTRMWGNDCGSLFSPKVSKNAYREDSIGLSNHLLFTDLYTALYYWE